MKVLIINYEFPPLGGGAGNASYYLARHLSLLGHEATVLTSAFRGLPKEEKLNGFQIYRIPVFRRRLDRCSVFEMITFIISALFYCNGVINRFKPEKTMAFFSIPSGIIAYCIRMRYSLPYILSLRGGDVPGNEKKLNWIHKLLSPIRHYVMKNSVKVVANSSGLKALSEKVDPFPVQMIPNGVDIEFYKPEHYENSCFRFLFVGRFQEQKNLFYLFKQMDRLKRTTGIPFELHLVGDGPQREKLLSFVNTLAIKDSVRWHGWCGREETRTHYQHADCLLNPSLYEGMPNVVLEGMACGLPVIASNVIGNTDIVKAGVTGFLFDLNNETSFQDAAGRILEDKDMRLLMGLKGREFVESRFSWNNVAREYLK